MAVKKTKPLSAQATTATVADSEKIVKVDANNIVTLIDLPNLRKALTGGISLDCLTDGAFIAYHRKTDNYPLLAKPHKWPDRQSAGEIADGVVIVEGGKMLMVAPTEADSAGLPWASAAVSGSATATTDGRVAADDWDGEGNTQAAISVSSSAAVTNTGAYAPGFCHLYSRSNGNGGGQAAGKWWLPSLGELLMLYANMAKINYCLGLITGGVPLTTSNYWSSTEVCQGFAWAINFADGTFSAWDAHNTAKCRVRPVSYFGPDPW